MTRLTTISIVVLCVCLFSSSASAFGKNKNSNQQKANDLVKWLRSKKGGYFNKKIAYQPIGSDEENANIGLFAVKAIAKNETLIVIPREALLTSTNGFDDDSVTNNNDDVQDGDMCYTAWNLVRAYKKVQAGQPTPFEPYVRYIFGDISSVPTQNKRQQHLPSAWSLEAQELLQTVLGHELGPRLLGGGSTSQSMSDSDFAGSCRHVIQDYADHVDIRDIDWNDDDDESEDRRLFQDCWFTVIARSWNEVMIPVYDIVNHRNGHTWHNMDQATSAHDEDTDVVVVALRDVAAGEPLHISYNECRDSDCEGLETTYVLPSILKDYGFVEQYPRRWRIDLGEDGDYNEDDHVVFEIDQSSSKDGGEEKLTLRWMSSYPEPLSLTLEQTSFLRGHLIRQQDLQAEILEGVKPLESDHERDTIVEFQQALTTALQMVLNHADPTQILAKQQLQQQQACVDDTDSDSDSEQCQAQYYDDLSTKQQLQQEGKGGAGSDGDGDDEEEEEPASVCSGDSSLYLGDARVETIDETFSHYQGIRFEHNFERDETCLYLSDWLQTCSSFRPHYHEAVVHIPASYVDEVKRVIYLGGGDNMMLHEVLKYPSLELVMGFELDQQVVRSSFKNLGTQPHFDNEKVQWWFGDATKSLSMLPQDYWGTFDLVIVDLQTNVAETLQVTKDMTIMDAAMRLMRADGGVISRNEDFYPRRSVGFAKYEVDIELFDVPVLCQQSITMGSKTVDFLRKEPKDHGIESVYLNKNKKKRALHAAGTSFGDWYNYRYNSDQDAGGPACQASNMAAQEGEELETMGQNRGFHLILEVEDALGAIEPIEKVRESIAGAVAKVGLTQKSNVTSDDDVFFFLLQEGYLLVQRFAEEQYFAFDIKIWTDYDKAETLKKALIDVVGGGGSPPTAYRIVASGMSGLPKSDSVSETIPGSLCDEKSTTDDSEQTTEKADMKEVLSSVITRQAMFLTQAQEDNAAVAVFCADTSSPCETLEALSEIESRIIAVKGCPSDSLEDMLACEDTILKALEDGTSAKGKIGVIVIDLGATKATGQVLHKILSTKSLRMDLLKEAYVVLSLSSSGSSWRKALIEKFQTDFDLYSPAYRSQVSFNSTTNALDLDIFSSGDSDFFIHLESVVLGIENHAGLAGKVLNVNDGMINYVADFFPSVISTNANYDLEDSFEQYFSQTPVQHQTIFQFQVQAQLTQLEAGERVLVEETQDIWKGTWVAGRVVKELDDGTYIVALDDNEELEAPRSALRRFETESSLEEREMVLIRRVGGYWSQGAVIEKSAEDDSFRLRMFDSNGDVMTAKRIDLVKRFEASDTSHIPSMTAAGLRKAFTSALESVDIHVGEEAISAFDGVVGAGSVIFTFWAEGVAIATWDGQTNIEINLFTEEENSDLRDDFSDTIVAESPFLLLASRDELPRGFGRIVNFPSDTEGDDPHWTDLSEEDDEGDDDNEEVDEEDEEEEEGDEEDDEEEEHEAE